MKHPHIRQSGNGLPPTSDIPWSEEGEKFERFMVVFHWIGLWMFVIVSVPLFYKRFWPVLVLNIAGVVFFAVRLVRHRAIYIAMRLNRPRDTTHLTQWIQHPWLGWEIVRRQFLCDCGHEIDLSRATYFKDTQRFSMVCDCGRGHFQCPPAEAIRARRSLQ
jgi:hypothetical protein